MARYIDADALLQELSVFNDREHGNEHFLFGIETAKEIVENQPTAYSVESVERGVKGYFCEVIEKRPKNNVPFEILDYSKAVCNIIRNGGKAGVGNAE